MRILLTGAALLLLGAVFGFIGFQIGQVLQGSPALFALVLGFVAMGGVWWWTSRKN